jgi:DNA-binding transcriptional LysR family regulator
VRGRAGARTARSSLTNALHFVMRRLPVKNIEAFVAVARAGSLARARAAESHGAGASRRIQLLEAELGTRMLNGSSAGSRLLKAATTILPRSTRDGRACRERPRRCGRGDSAMP